MNPLAISKKTRAEQVYDRLRQLITGPELACGDRLQPVRTLAGLFETSVPTVMQALSRLADEGLVDRRPGSGVYVAAASGPSALAGTVVLCLEAGAHVFGDLASRLLHELQARQYVAGLVDNTSPNADVLLRAISQSDAGCLVVHGNLHFPFSILQEPALQRQPVIGVIDWETDLELPGVTCVLSDYERGGRLVAEHLAELGHDHILIVGSSTQIWFLDHEDRRVNPLQRSFVAAWAGRNGTWEALASRETDTTTIDEEALTAIFRHPEPPTAIFGLRDTEAGLASRILKRRLPQVAEKVAVIGYYDTPWATSADPAMTSVNLNLEALAAAVMDRLDPLLAGCSRPGDSIRIPPVLKVRETSRRRSTW